MQPLHDRTERSVVGPPSESLHGRFSAIAAARPDAPALLHHGERIGYGLLDRASNAYAVRLADHGVGRGDLVPLRLPRSPELVAAVLAVLKLGAAYALIDERWPDGRVADVLTQLDAGVMVAAQTPPVTDGGADGPPVGLWTPPTGGLASVAADAPGFVPVEVSGHESACVFFTSGTTGRPKGVLSPHRATTRLFRPGTFARFGPGTVLPQAAPVPWDAYSLELWAALLNGGTSLVVEEPYLSPAVLRAGIEQSGVDTVWLTGSLFNMLIDEDPTCLRGLRQVMTGGERLSVPHVRAFLAAHPDTTLLNGYGPVESTVFATVHRVVRQDCERPDGIPVGRPVPGTSVHILDGARACGTGEPGEICVAGDGLALGYLGRPELTAEKFSTVTVDGRAVRVYRTGDLGHRDEDGLLHYHGRADRQVKIRGHRLEPAEVEAQIERLLPQVRRCVVLPLRDASGAYRALAAFCRPYRAGDPLDGALRQLAPHLVQYHLPAHLLTVEDFPLTANGKLDEAALLALVPRRGGPAAPDAPPDAPGGETLAALVSRTFAAVLGLPDIPPATDFTALGGSSLDAGRVCARLAGHLGHPVPVSALLRGRTAEALTGWLQEHARSAPDIPAGQESDAVPLSPAQRGFLVAHLRHRDGRDAHCLTAWVVEGAVDRAALGAAVADVHHRHAALASAYRIIRGRAFAVPDPAPAPEVTALTGHATVQDALDSVRRALDASLDPEHGRLWRAVLAPVGGARWVLGYAVHHIAFDGWSEAVLAADLATAYNARRTGREPAWPAVLSAAQVHGLRAAHLHRAPTEDRRDEVAARLRGVPELRFPRGTQEAAAPLLRTEIALEPEVVAAVDALGTSTGQTRFAVLLSCYARALAATTGQEDFGIGVPVAQRFDERLERTVGCHIGTVCVRVTPRLLSEDPATSAVEAGRLTREALACQDIGIDEVVRAAGPPRSSRAPFYQNLFVLQDNAPPVLALDGCTTRHHRLPYLDGPAEIQAEVWPGPDGVLRLVITSGSAAVAPAAARRLATAFADLITVLASA
ncbi:amino acid adenylation domain-containing protein [Streptomyces violaceorubidus]